MGYGDLAPTTLGGRALACLCAFIGKNPSHLDVSFYPSFRLTAIAGAGTATITLANFPSLRHHFLLCPLFLHPFFTTSTSSTTPIQSKYHLTLHSITPSHPSTVLYCMCVVGIVGIAFPVGVLGSEFKRVFDLHSLKIKNKISQKKKHLADLAKKESISTNSKINGERI